MSALKFFSNLSSKQRSLILNLMTPIEIFSEVIDYFIPKDKKLIICGSDSGQFRSGSPKAFFEDIKNSNSCYSIFYYSPLAKIGIIPKMQYIISFAPIYFRARFLVGSHPPKDFLPFSWSKRKIFVNTWHGIPLKAMFFADKGDTRSSLRGILQLNRKTTLFVVSSKIERSLIQKCFRIDSKKVVLTGHPRNECLLTNSSSAILPKNMQMPSYKKIILYCPTYRRDASTVFFPFKEFDKKCFADFLEKHKIILLIREHIYNKRSQIFFSERILPFGFDVQGDINSILPKVDILLTDYSSIYIDYLLVNKPIIFIPYDLATYTCRRGFLLDYTSWTPGPKVTTYADFIKALENAISGEDGYELQRNNLKLKFHSHQTLDSSKKILDLLIKT
jgi:CDP-glycerol glycerophosphotransferase (TagB/SpsB family)